VLNQHRPLIQVDNIKRLETIMKNSAKLCIVLIMTSSVILAQSPKTSPTSIANTAVKPTVENRHSKPDEMREQQLRVFREHVLARALDNVKKMDEAGLRISARNQLLTYLTSETKPSDEKQTLATQIARDVLADISEHNEEISTFMLSYLSNDLGSWIQKYRPNLIEDFERTIKTTAQVDASQRIHALFELDGGDVLAAKRIRQELEVHGTLNRLNFWLDELMKRNSKEFEPLASDIVTRAGQGQISFETLFWVSDIYLRPQTSSALRNRFLAIVVTRTQPANFVTEPAPQLAYDLLIKLLPFVQQSTPELYDQALNHTFAMRASLNERQLASEARIKRLNESVNPIADLKSEAESAKTKTERNELLLQAAQLALQKKKLDLCLDIIDDVDINIATTEPGFWQRSIDQTLKNFVKVSLTAKLTDLAEKGAERIASSVSKVEALNLVMRYYTKANDKEAAQRLLIVATKVAGSGSDNSEKAKAFLLLTIACDQVDRSKKADLLLSGLKALNDISKPDTDAHDRSSYQSYVQHLDNVGYELTKGFTGLTKQDENEALALVEKLQKPDLRTYALIGILLGLDNLLTIPL
jgi:hypothetical protein